MVRYLRAMQETQDQSLGWEDPLVGKIPWRRSWQPTPVLLPENPMDRGAWWATIHGVAKGQTGLRDSHTHTHTHTHNMATRKCLRSESQAINADFNQ